MSEQIYGIHAVNSILAHAPERLIEVFVLKGREDKRLQPLLNQLYMLGIGVQFVNRQTLDKKANDEVHQGVIARVQAAKEFNENDLDAILANKQNPLLLVLDGVTDPHNLGALLRTADAIGIHGILIPKRRSVPLNATVAKTSAGAIEHVPVARIGNVAQTVRRLKEKGLWVIGADMTGEVAWKADLTGPTLLIVGSEGHGMSRLTRELCDIVVKLPMHGKINSLNASVAGGVLAYEILRQRSLK